MQKKYIYFFLITLPGYSLINIKLLFKSLAELENILHLQNVKTIKKKKNISKE